MTQSKRLSGKFVDGIAFRVHGLSAKDWETVSWVKRIAMNLSDLNQILDAGGE